MILRTLIPPRLCCSLPGGSRISVHRYLYFFQAHPHIYLYRREEALKKGSLFLLTRGLWLIALELTLITFAFWFDLSFGSVLFQVIYAIGMSMVLMSVLIYLPNALKALLGLLILTGQYWLERPDMAKDSIGDYAWSLFLQPGFRQVTSHTGLFVAYPALPWLGIMLLGYAMGPWYKLMPAFRKKLLITAGISAIVLFIVLRSLNGAGDHAHWEVRDTPLFTFLSFINITKYPPSLLFCIVHTGTCLVVTGLYRKCHQPRCRVFSKYMAAFLCSIM